MATEEPILLTFTLISKKNKSYTMKTNLFKSTLFLALVGMTFTACVKEDDYKTPSADCIETTLQKTIEVSELSATAIPTQYTADDVIEAYVTSSDKGGNFYKSISFSTLDGSRAFSVPVDVTSTFTNFEPGRKVLIKLKDLYLDSPATQGLGMRIGGIYVNPTSGVASVGRLSVFDYGKVLNRSCTVIGEDEVIGGTTLVKHVTVEQAKSDAYINRLIELDNVQFTDAAITTTYYDAANDLGGATNHYLTDIEGNKVIFRTSSFANYAGNPVATGSGKVRGVMTAYKSGATTDPDYQFVARSEADIKLTQPRFKTLLNDGFDTNVTFLTQWTSFSVTGAEVWSHSTTYGNPGGMVKMSGYNGGNNTNEDWLISPSQDLTSLTTAYLSFDNAYKFTGDPIKVYISNNYSGSGSPYATGVTWTELIIPASGLSTGNYAYANSGYLDITSFTGAGNNNVYVAFKYTSSTSAGSTWEIDNVKISKNN